MLSGKAIEMATQAHQDYLQSIQNSDPSRKSQAQQERLRLKPRIVIDPYRAEQLNPNSYNLRLGSKLLVYDRQPSVRNLKVSTKDGRREFSRDSTYTRDIPSAVRHYTASRQQKERPIEPIELAPWSDVLDMARPNDHYELDIPPGGLVLVPGKLYLGSTVEHTETYNLAPFIEGRSSVGRLGMTTHITAGFGDCFFKGSWTLEITVVEPLRVYAGVEVCQIGYSPLVGEATDYQGKYQGQREPKPSHLWRDFQLTEKSDTE